MPISLKERFEQALTNRGEKPVKTTFKYNVYSCTRTDGVTSYYYVGRSGSLRIGANVASSIPVSPALKATLLSEYAEAKKKG